MIVNKLTKVLPLRLLLRYALLSFGSFVFSSDIRDVGQVATNFEQSFTSFGKLIVAISYSGGVGFGIAAVYKFKQYKDNPTQIPVSTPFALMIVSVLMVFLPGFSEPIANSLFGSTSGEAAFVSSKHGCHGLPGGTNGGCPG
jgi:hypothetical protein